MVPLTPNFLSGHGLTNCGFAIHYMFQKCNPHDWWMIAVILLTMQGPKLWSQNWFCSMSYYWFTKGLWQWLNYLYKYFSGHCQCLWVAFNIQISNIGYSIVRCRGEGSALLSLLERDSLVHLFTIHWSQLALSTESNNVGPPPIHDNTDPTAKTCMLNSGVLIMSSKISV